MLLRKIRLLGIMAAGVLLAVISLAWIYFFDVTVKSGVNWLYGALFFGLIGGGLTIYSGYASGDEEKILSSILLGVSLLLCVGLIVFLFQANTNEALLLAAKKNGGLKAYKALNIIAIVISFICSALIASGLGLDIFAKFQSKMMDKQIEANLVDDENLTENN